MANFNRRETSGGRDFNRDSFSRGPRRPVQMHHAVCGKCGMDCEVPFKPTAGKPVYCSKCFDRDTTPRSENFQDRNRSNSFESRSNFRSEGPRESFSAVCANCGKDCTLPFQPRTDKPVYCSNCFEKNGGGSRERRESPQQSQPQNTKQLDMLNAKLDKILKLLGAEDETNSEPKSEVEVAEKESVIEEPQETTIVTEVKPKRVKKTPKKV